MIDKEQKHDEQDKKEQAAESMRTRCKICFKETFPNRKCGGHGGGGGGDTNGSDSGEKIGQGDLANIPGQIIDTVAQAANAITKTTTQTIDGLNLSQQPQLTFNPEVISELLSKKLLLIDNNRDIGILTIKLQCKPSDLSEEERNELKKFVNAILKELDEFKKEKGISSNCEIIDKNNKSNLLSLPLLITLPIPTVYDAFIQRLANKNLLPIQNIEQKEKVVYKTGMNYFNPSPLSMKPIPIMNKSVKSTDEEKQKISSIRPRSPLDGLKPKGW